MARLTIRQQMQIREIRNNKDYTSNVKRWLEALVTKGLLVQKNFRRKA